MAGLFRTSDRIDMDDGFHLTMIDRSDATCLVKYLNEEEYHHQTLSIPYPYRISDADIFIDQVLQWEADHNLQRDWAIRDHTGEQIGGIGLLYDHGITSHKSSLGYWLAKPFWNQGIMTGVLTTFCSFIYEHRPITRLEAQVFTQNLASCRVLEKAGFKREGILHKSFKKGDTYIDSFLYALLAPDIMDKNGEDDI